MKTKTTIRNFFATLALTAIAVNVSAFEVSKNTFVNIGKNTQFKVSNLDLDNHGTFACDSSSQLILHSTGEMKISGNDFYLSHLKIDGHVVCDVPVLALGGDLTVQSGVLDIGANRLIIAGDLIDETANSYLTASTGTIEKWLDYLPAGQETDALGLKFTPLTDLLNVVITRSHGATSRPTSKSTASSAFRIYEFSMPADMTAVHLQALPHEKPHLAKERIFAESFDGWKKVVNQNEDLYNVFRLSVFEPDDLHFPKILTPSEGRNEVFYIQGLDEYPDSRLVVMSRQGKILQDLCPYKNDFDGKYWPDGTYYYVFYENGGGAPLKKSFFEIIRK